MAFDTSCQRKGLAFDCGKKTEYEELVLDLGNF
jgi:hypothetical protein